MLTIGTSVDAWTIGRGPAGSDDAQTVHARTAASSVSMRSITATLRRGRQPDG